MRNLSTPSRRMLAAACLLALAGCDQIDPLERPYVWHETEVNTHNIAAMAVNPADLVQGRASTVRHVRADADAVDKVWTNKPSPLLSTTGGPGPSPTAAGGGT